ncbi:MAG: efflux RND transporter periplasmic adaptor subunit [Lentisphaeraceae bacterium]|nr:efflux RND transporter periplasmic adaptor subunit [Lentisphaeraceae bacterium]
MSSLFNTETNTNLKPPRRGKLILIPLLLIAGIAATFFYTGWNQLATAVPVEAIRARLSNTSGNVSAGKTLFQAAGWIHADPYPINATALVSGIVTKVHVLDGQQIKKGQLLAELNSEDYQLALEEAEASYKELVLNIKQQELKINIIKSKIEEQKSLQNTAIAMAETVKHKMLKLRKSGIAISDFDKEQAELEYQEKLLKAKEFETKIKVLKSEIIQQKQFVDIAKAKVEIQETKISKLELDLKRCKIHSPIDGIIQELYARVGRKQMLGSDVDISTTVAKIFNPKHILVMVDVPLNDLRKIKINQKTKIRLEAIPDILEGVVTALHGKADYQKNTLQIHVNIPGGHPDIRPDMLAQVEFLSDKSATKTVEKSGIFIDKKCLINKSSVFVINLEQKAELRTISVGNEVKDGWIEILSGINAGEKVILSPPSSLQEETKVKVEDLHE